MESVLDLALNAKLGHDSLKNISERRKISENYLEQIFVVLRRKGIVKSIRGAGGGYQLAKPASQITAGEVLRAVEGPLAPVKCIVGDPKKHCCDNFEVCVTKYIWTKIMNGINESADSVTIADLVECCDLGGVVDEIEYFI
jgi:Rrf2 family protein